MTTPHTCPACGFKMSHSARLAVCPNCYAKLAWNEDGEYTLMPKAGLPEDPQVELEDRLAETIARQAREVLVPLAKSITAENAQRVLGPMCSLVSTYNNAIAELYTDFDARPKKRTGAGDGISISSSSSFLDTSETFGAQAIQQLVPIFKDLIPTVMGQRNQPPAGREISRLTSALAEARGMGEPMAAVADKIEKRLNALLENDMSTVLDVDGEEISDDLDCPLPPQLVGGFPPRGEGQDEEHLDGDGPDAGRGGTPDEVREEGAEEGLAQ